MALRKTEFVYAKESYFESDEAKGSCNASTLVVPECNVYLRNRLDRAFTAGWEACRKRMEQLNPTGSSPAKEDK